MTDRTFGGAGLALMFVMIGFAAGDGIASAGAAGPSGRSAAIRAEYEKRKGEAARDAASQTRLALWCEGQGLTEEKDQHLARALVADPLYPLARAMMGMTSHQGRWTDVAAVPDRVRADADLAAKLAEYNAKRQGIAETADDHWKLAVWCESQGLADEASAHFANVIKLDPTRESAWKRLGYKKMDGRWVTREQLDDARTETKAQREADELWTPRFKRWREMLTEPLQRSEAESEMANVNDPRAIPALWRILALNANEHAQQAALDLLSRIPGPTATRGIVELALNGKTESVRRQASETLRSRDPREYAPLLISKLAKPIAYSILPGNGTTTAGSLRLEGRTANYLRQYQMMSLPETLSALGVRQSDRLALDNDGQAVIQRRTQSFLNDNTGSRVRRELVVTQTLPLSQVYEEMGQGIGAAQQRLNQDIAILKARNSRIQEFNDKILVLLSPLSPQQFGSDPEAWDRWWTEDQAGYSYQPPRRPDPSVTVVQNIRAGYQPRIVPETSSEIRLSLAHSCFIAGTLVRTLQGTAAIETIKAGDRVLTQDLATGELGYRAVVQPVRNPPASVLLIRLEGDDVPTGATGIHRFWKAGQGWAMARDLKVGDAIRTLKGVRKIVGIENGQPQPVFNLVVADHSNFFVGESGSLVHDNSIVEPTAQPFDRP